MVVAWAWSLVEDRDLDHALPRPREERTTKGTGMDIELAVAKYRGRIMRKTLSLRWFGDDDAWTAIKTPEGYLDLNVWRDPDNGKMRVTAYPVVDGVADMTNGWQVV